MASYKSTLFSPCPWQLMDALPTNIKANAVAIYLVIHRRGFMQASGQATVPINEISAEAGVGQKATRTALRWLVAEGWVTRIDQIGGASFYRVWTDEPKRTPRKSAKGSTPGKSAKGTPRKAAMPPSQNCQGTPRNFAGDIYIQELEELEKKNSPIPVSLSSPPESSKSEPNSPQPAAAVDRDQDPEQPAKRKAKAPRIRITTADLPMDLLACVAEDYVTWWNEARKGQCTERALKAELNQLRKIAEDPAGGRAAVEAQVRQAVENYELGKKPWEAITYANWRSFSADYRRAAGTTYRKPNPWENEHGRSLLEQARFEGLVP